MLITQVSRLLRRAPWRTALSFLMLFVMTFLLSLGVGLWARNGKLIQKAETDFVTLAVFDAMGEADLSPVINDPAVLRGFDPSEIMRSLAGYHAKSADACQDKVVLLLTGVVPNSVGSYSGHVTEVYYAAKPITDAYTVTVEGLPDGIGRDERVLVHGSIGYGTTGLENIRLEKEGELPPYVRLQEGEAVPEAYLALAEGYIAVNSRVVVYPTRELETVTAFHQSERVLESGRAFTGEEYLTDAAVAVVSGEIAAQMSLAVGDDITLREGDEAAVYEVVGITNISTELPPTVYIPVRAPEKTSPVSSEVLRLVVRSDQATAFTVRAEKALPSGVRMTVYDQGYGAVKSNLESIGRIAVIIGVLAGALSAAALLLFAYRWVDFVKETLVTMHLLGAGKGFAAGYLLLSGGAVAGAAAVTGSLCGGILSGDAVTALYMLLEKAGSKAAFYHLSSLGQTKPFALTAPAPLGGTAVTALAMLSGALLLLGLFARPVLARPVRKRERRRQVKIRRPVHAPGVFRYALTAVVRRPVESAAVLLLTLLTTLTVITVTAAGASAETRLQTVSENFCFRVDLRSYNGRKTDDILIQAPYVEKLRASGLAEEFAVTVRDQMVYGGKANSPIPFVWPTTSYAMETFSNKVREGPSILYTNNPAFLPEFAAGAVITYAAGYDSTVFASWQDGEEIPVVLEEGMMAENGLAVGDRILLHVCILPDEMLEKTSRFVVIGSYQAVTSRAYAYAPLAAVYPAQAEEKLTAHQRAFGEYLYIGTGGYWWPDRDVPEEKCRTALAENLCFDAAGCTVAKDNIAAFRDFLWKEGFSAVGKTNRLRVYVTVDDLQYAREIVPLERYVKTIGILLPVIFLLIAVEGYAASYLAINSRKGEMLVMRGLGASKKWVFGTFFAEEAVLCLLGGVTGLSAAAAAIGLPAGGLWRWGVFLVCYLLGAAVSVVRAVRSDDLQAAFAALES